MRRGKTPTGPLRSVVRMRAQTHTVYRPTGQSTAETEPAGFGEEDTDLSGSGWASHQTALDLFPENENPEVYPTGESITRTRDGMALPDADVQAEDVVAHGGRYYEVETLDEWPDETNAKVYRLRLSERPHLAL